MKINQALTEAVNKLKQAKINSPHLDAEILLSNILKKPREFILAHPEKQLTKTQITNYKLQISRRIKGMPVAYIIGHKEFYGLDFFINKHVLIPRPETELIVEEAIRITRNVKRVTLIDIGTGCGCIIIALAKKLNLKSEILNLKFYATDISKPVLTIARKNAKLHNVHHQIKFLHGNLLVPIIESKNIKSAIGNRQSAIIILANLPYLTPTQIKNSPDIQHEPKQALNGGSNGLKYYRQLFKQIKQITNYKLPITVLLEIDPSQTKKIKQLAKNKLPRCKCKTKKDLVGHNRLIILTLK